MDSTVLGLMVALIDAFVTVTNEAFRSLVISPEDFDITNHALRSHLKRKRLVPFLKGPIQGTRGKRKMKWD